MRTWLDSKKKTLHKANELARVKLPSAQKYMKKDYNLDMHTKKYKDVDWSFCAAMREK